MFYLIIDGLDGSGKDTQARLISAWLREKGICDPLVVNEPWEGCDEGRLLRKYLGKGTHISAHLGLFMAQRWHLQEEVICPALERGTPVISVRGFPSTFVYQSNQMPLDTLVEIHKHMLVKPHAVVILDVSTEETLARIGNRGTREYYEKAERQEKYAQQYRDLGSNPEIYQNLLSPLPNGHYSPWLTYPVQPGSSKKDTAKDLIRTLTPFWTGLGSK